MPISAAMAQSMRTLEDAVSSARKERSAVLRIELSQREKIEADWKVVLPGLRNFLQAASTQTGVLNHSVSRDEAEVSVKLRNASAKNGANYLILSRAHPTDPQVGREMLWLCEVGQDPVAYPDALEGARSLIKRVIAAVG